MATVDSKSVRNCLKDAVGWIFTVAVVLVFIVLVTMKVRDLFVDSVSSL